MTSHEQPPAPPGQYDEWRRTHARSLLVLPLTAARTFLLPALVAAVGIGSRQPKAFLLIAPLLVVGAVGAGSLVWATTRYRIADGRLEVRRGLLLRRSVTAPIDRIRSVDLEATILHRVLGLQKVAVGTGVDDTRIELDSLSREQAEELRTLLLGLARSRPASSTHPAYPASPSAVGPNPAGGNDAASVPSEHGAAATTGHPGSPPTLAGVGAPGDHGTEPEEVLAVLDPRWARFAPFSLVRLAVVGAAVGALSQFDVPVVETGAAVWDRLLQLSLVVVVVGLVVGALVAWTLLSVVGYLVQWWDMRLVREGGNLRLTRGLLTTASTTVEVPRIRGVEVSEPLLLRLVDGAEAKALVTGLDSGVYPVLPQVPREVAAAVGSRVLWLGDEPRGVDPLAVDLVRHGPAATRRCHVRGQLGWTGWVLPAAALAWWQEWLPPGVLVAAVVVAVLLGVASGVLSSRHLGHALTDDHLVVGSGSATRTRTVLERAGVIGWVMSQNPLQRRSDLVTLVATTAAGSERVTITDVPRPLAEQLVVAVTPG